MLAAQLPGRRLLPPVQRGLSLLLGLLVLPAESLRCHALHSSPSAVLPVSDGEVQLHALASGSGGVGSKVRREPDEAESGGNVTRTLFDGLQLLSAETEGPVCVAVTGKFMGRLSNTVSMINEVLRFATNASRVLNKEIAFRFPQAYTPWMKRSRLDTIFGSELACGNQSVRTYPAWCPPVEGINRCRVRDLLVNAAAEDTRDSTLCNCSRVVLVSSDDIWWEHEYDLTRNTLSERFWTVHADKVLVPGFEKEIPGAFPRQVVMHVRLGDIENNCSARFTAYNCNKKLNVDQYILTLQALVEVLPPHCMELSLVTDGQLTSPDIVYVLKNLTNSGIPKPQVWTANQLDAEGAFEFMTHADVLVYGPSGFGQLAAVLAKNHTARLGNPMPDHFKTDPLYFLPNTTQLRVHQGGFFNMTEAVLQIRQNEAIQAYAADCRQRTLDMRPGT
uniref:O-fucosyltransferase family protein n=1 Tax=Pyrodinium bahamense TaxID=73915 RepID=A0A7S0AE60_9DINO|mmetsp:Transcript_32141/g.88675  ORF Transcript_32141/g.88675 Transcript_32141/m.88675 type:complete len:447 (+) Transcript_32141:103-1443(+)